jgi:hypothetical protein
MIPDLPLYEPPRCLADGLHWVVRGTDLVRVVAPVLSARACPRSVGLSSVRTMRPASGEVVTAMSGQITGGLADYPWPIIGAG